METKMADIELLRKKLHFQGTHRGTKENDIVLGNFIQHHLPAMDAGQLIIFADFLQELDGDIYAWLIRGENDYPSQYQDLIQNIRAHQQSQFE